MKLLLLLFLWLFISSVIVINNDPPSFGTRVEMGELENDEINEASGLVASSKNIGILWTHNDSGGENRIFAVDTNGINKGTFYLEGVENRDWEDIAIGSGPDNELSYIYIGDIGDNSANNKTKYIYRIVEPTILANQFNVVDTIQDVSTICFTYPDDQRDAETLLHDPITKDLFILGKRDSKARLYRLPFPQSTSDVFEAELTAKISFPNDPEVDVPNNYITGGDISADGTEIIVKSYKSVYYWKREAGKSITETMLNIPGILDYISEPQGEAICWRNSKNNGYFTTSEENINFGGIVLEFPAKLYYYPRKIEVTNIVESHLFENFVLEQNFPNPFNPTTKIKYSIPSVSETKSDLFVQLKVYNIIGEEITTLVNERLNAGNYEVLFDADNLSTGIYYYTLKFGNLIRSKKMILLK